MRRYVIRKKKDRLKTLRKKLRIALKNCPAGEVATRAVACLPRWVD